MTDLFSKFDPLIAERQALLDTGVRDPFAIVMDFVASVEDEFDILITMNMQAEIETVGQLVDAIESLRNEGERRA